MPESRIRAIDWNAKLVDWFIHNTQLVAIVFLALVVGGAFSFMSLRREGFPSPDINVAVIQATYRGASSEEVERSLVKPLESAALATKGVDEVRSTSYPNFGVVQVAFEAGYDSKAGISELRNKIQNATLPKNADKPEVTVPSIGGNTSYYALVGADQKELRKAGEVFRREMESVSGVKEVRLSNEPKDKVEVKWRAADLAANGSDPMKLQQALLAANVTIPAGTVQTGNRMASVVTQGSFATPQDVQNTVIGVSGGVPPRPVKVRDVAEVRAVSEGSFAYANIGYKDEDALGPISVGPGLLYFVDFKPTADVIASDREIRDVLDRMQREGSLKPAKLVTIYSVGDMVNEQIQEIREGAVGGPLGDGPLSSLGWILGGIQLVILAMLLFVSWRAALISAAAIPLSLLFTFLALKVEGVTLNTLTLFSMILVLGLIVDPAIVVLEAIQREMDLGRRGSQAVIAALNTIGAGVFMAVFTSIIVFVPFAVVSGIFGEIIRYIPLTVLPALLASYFVPLLFLTYLARRFLKPSKVTKDDEEVANLWKASQWFIRANRYILRRKWLQACVVVAAVAIPLGVTGYLFSSGKVVPVQFSEQDDVEQLVVTVSYPQNLPKSVKNVLVTATEPYLTATPEILSYVPIDSGDSQTQLFITLVDKETRERTSTEIVDELKGIFGNLSNSQELVFYSVVAQGIGLPQSDFPVAVNIYGDSLDALKKAAVASGDVLRKQERVTRVEDGFTNVSNPQFEVIVNRDKASAAGLAPAQVAQTVAGLLGENTVTRFDQDIDGAVRGTDVVLVNSTLPNTKADVEDMVIGAGSKGVVRVKDVATVQQGEGFTGIQHLNGSRYVTVKAQVEDALKDAAAPQKAVKDYWTGERLAEYGLRSDALQDKGSANEFVESFKDLFIALGISILLTYFVFVLFFRSFIQPFIILFAIPLSFVGAFPALAAIGGQFGFLEILGIIVLVSIVENVGIFLIDLANRKQLEGDTPEEAVAVASGVRFRAIFLTKITALGGLLPLIIISPLWRPLAVVVTAGIITSGVLSLFTTPVLYVWINHANEWLAKRRKARAA